jgi:hypothetical protein
LNRNLRLERINECPKMKYPKEVKDIGPKPERMKTKNADFDLKTK